MVAEHFNIPDKLLWLVGRCKGHVLSCFLLCPQRHTQRLFQCNIINLRGRLSTFQIIPSNLQCRRGLHCSGCLERCFVRVPNFNRVHPLHVFCPTCNNCQSRKLIRDHETYSNMHTSSQNISPRMAQEPSSRGAPAAADLPPTPSAHLTLLPIQGHCSLSKTGANLRRPGRSMILEPHRGRCRNRKRTWSMGELAC
jgi:hypothetical protein